jgi:hypothetical protein
LPRDKLFRIRMMWKSRYNKKIAKREVRSLRMRRRDDDVVYAARLVIMLELVRSMWKHLMKRIAVKIN